MIIFIKVFYKNPSIIKLINTKIIITKLNKKMALCWFNYARKMEEKKESKNACETKKTKEEVVSL